MHALLLYARAALPVYALPDQLRRVNVFFDETVLPPLPAPNVPPCQGQCGGAPNNGNCPCNASSTPANCMWQRCSPIGPFPPVPAHGESALGRVRVASSCPARGLLDSVCCVRLFVYQGAQTVPWCGCVPCLVKPHCVVSRKHVWLSHFSLTSYASCGRVQVLRVCVYALVR